MKKNGAFLGVLFSAGVLLLGALVLSGAIFSLNYGISSFTPYRYDSGWATFGGDSYTYISNNTAAVASHVNHLYETLVKLSGIFLMVLGGGCICLFSTLRRSEDLPAAAAPAPAPAPAPAFDDEIPEI